MTTLALPAVGLSLTQPWASLCAWCEKMVETRSWPARFRGPFAIHAAKGFPVSCRELCEEEPFASALERHGVRSWKDLPLGAIVGTASLDECGRIGRRNGHVWLDYAFGYRQRDPDDGIPVTGDEVEFGDYTPGRFGFVMTKASVIETPIFVKGALQFWTLGEEASARVAAAMGLGPPMPPQAEPLPAPVARPKQARPPAPSSRQMDLGMPPGKEPS